MSYIQHFKMICIWVLSGLPVIEMFNLILFSRRYENNNIQILYDELMLQLKTEHPNFILLCAPHI